MNHMPRGALRGHVWGYWPPRLLGLGKKRREGGRERGEGRGSGEVKLYTARAGLTLNPIGGEGNLPLGPGGPPTGIEG